VVPETQVAVVLVPDAGCGAKDGLPKGYANLIETDFPLRRTSSSQSLVAVWLIYTYQIVYPVLFTIVTRGRFCPNNESTDTLKSIHNTNRLFILLFIIISFSN
jgi:hypothetical protein